MKSKQKPSRWLRWFSGLSIYRVPALSDGEEKWDVYEERMVVVRAASFQEATRKLKAEAGRYARGCTVKHELVKFQIIYDSLQETLAEGTEVWSVFKESKLSPVKYLQKYHASDLENMLVRIKVGVKKSVFLCPLLCEICVICG